MKSLLSVVADSSIVEVWIIDKKMMEYLKEKDKETNSPVFIPIAFK
jgi:hypothetical protein